VSDFLAEFVAFSRNFPSYAHDVIGESFHRTNPSNLAQETPMPKVVRFHETGGPEVLKFEDVSLAQPGTGEVRLKVQAIGLNRAESMFYRGRYIYEPKLPAGLGYEAAGVVEAVGPGVDKSWIGKQVSIIPSFSLNEYSMVGETALAPVDSLGEYPANLSPAEGAAIWMQYVTAYGALKAIAKVTQGDFVVIPAASSSVGLPQLRL
jgi:NADPH:quinone reductase-like Zn-dependent oxidoreductase